MVKLPSGPRVERARPASDEFWRFGIFGLDKGPSRRQWRLAQRRQGRSRAFNRLQQRSRLRGSVRIARRGEPGHAANPSIHGIRPSQPDHRLIFKTSEKRLTANTPVVGREVYTTNSPAGACMLLAALGSPAVDSLPTVPFARTGDSCPLS